MSGTPFLLIDAGNSRIKWAVVHADGAQMHTGTFGHGTASGDEPDWSGFPTPGSAWISNVAGEASAQRLDQLLDAYWPGLPRTTIRAVAQQCGVTNRYTTASALGSDRWAGLIGAHAAFPGEPLLIATFGTATTLEALRSDGTFVGGLIAPGWSLMMRSLGEHTAQLPTLGAASARDLLADGAVNFDDSHGAAVH
jgi:type III pantothenate kinase